jgi:hypothetical protein
MARKKAAKKGATRRIAKKATADLFAWNDPVAGIDAALQTLENQVAQGDLATPSLEGLKSALDELRLRAWGLLMATNADAPQVFQERFRIRRGKDMCRALCGDLQTGKLSARHPDLPELGAAAHDLAGMVDDAPRRAS